MSRGIMAVVVLGIVCGASSCSLWRKVTGRQKAVPAPDSTAIAARQDSILMGQDTAIARQDTAIVIPAPAADPKKQALLQTLLPLWNAQTAYNTFSGKAKVHYELHADGNGNNQDFTAVIRMERDRKIWISITALGLFEAARVLITPDTITAIDRIHKEVRILPFSDAGKLLPFRADFATLQALIVGDVLHTGAPPDEVIDTVNVFSIGVAMPGYTQTVAYNKSDTTIHRQFLGGRDVTLMLAYNDYSNAGASRFANSRTIQATDNGAMHNIELEFTKVSFNEAVDMSFSIPSKYERK